ncbi:hypothetical protein [Peribacillus kribbensis]|uniref:hypothetical protein n=1 Tax=Peribacillus kribbensis TaxID=356658 RepID=UPI00041079F1|nr:hypothetical protein [Peribacillus kribbensis]
MVVSHLAERVKKYRVWMVLIPILLGALGWVLPAGKTGDEGAEAEISLGSYENPNLNDPKKVIVLLSNLPFYKEHLPDMYREQQQDLLKDLSVTPISDQNIKVSYQHHPSKVSQEMVRHIADAFMALDKQKYEQKRTILEETIDTLKSETVGPDAKVDQQRFLYELQTSSLMMKPAVLLKEPDSGADETAAFSSKQRAVLGILIGLTLSLLWLVIPEFIREQK